MNKGGKDANETCLGLLGFYKHNMIFSVKIGPPYLFKT